MGYHARGISSGVRLRTRGALCRLDAELNVVVALGGLRIRKEKVAGSASAHGWMPDHVRLVFDDQSVAQRPNLLPAPPIHIDIPPFDSLVSATELQRLVEAFATDGLARVDATGAWTLLPRLGNEGDPWEGSWLDGRGALEVARGPILCPSKELMAGLNRRSARTAPFADFLAAISDEDWRAIADGPSHELDATRALQAQIAQKPKAFAAYKQLADHLSGEGARAAANLWLGLGYLRAHRVLGVAKAKLEAARAEQPQLPGLDEEFAELEAANSS